MTPPRPRHLLRLAALVAAMAALALLVLDGARQAGLARLDADLQNRLTLTRHAVTAQIERYRYLPALIGQDARILSLLDRPGDDRSAANAYLKATRALSGVDQIYVLDPQGRALAASNAGEPGSFVGQDYAFRPYFRQALTRGAARYYAVGVTTGIPGYFLASRIGSAEAPLGVAVAKVDMGGLQATWASADQSVALADAAGVVFLAGQPDWLFRPLDPLDDATARQLDGEQRYAGQAVPTAAPLRAALTGLRLAEVPLQPDGWPILAAEPLAPVERQAQLLALLAGLSGLLVSALAVGWRQRRQLIRVRLNQNAELERRVAERTEALAHEIDQRRRAQDELREAHESLVHAAKLAVLGRMSTTIVHEVSQPLSALDSTLAAAELHLGAGREARAVASLAAARALLMRMQKMVRNLKSFGARQRADPPEAVDMARVLTAGAEVLAPRLRDLGQRLALTLPPGLPAVSGQAVRLEQVVINLILNAAEAAAGAGARAPVRVALEPAPGGLRLTILDRGAGIDPALQDRIQEPFFTTRVTGEGLGLGLSITRGILDQIGATLAFHPRPGGGTVTVVDLPLYHDAAHPAAAPRLDDRLAG
ncbi:sensor histidine kinase [Paracoccus liaowanqingii]|nr:ATP-binding protein [Paracoccus liaowanqingii]